MSFVLNPFTGQLDSIGNFQPLTVGITNPINGLAKWLGALNEPIRLALLLISLMSPGLIGYARNCRNILVAARVMVISV